MAIKDEETKGTVTEPDEKGVTVKLGGEESGDDDDNDDGPPAAASPQQTEQQRTARQERRIERKLKYDEAVRLASEASERAARAEARAERVEQEVSRRREPEVKQPDDDEKLLDLTQREIDVMSAQFDALPEEQQTSRRQEFRDRYAKVKADQDAAAFRVNAKKAGWQPPGSQQARNPRAEATEAAIAVRHSDVYNNPKVLAYARTLAHQHYLKGGADGEEAVDGIMDKARSEFNMTPRHRATTVDDGDRRRLGGSSVGGAGGTTGKSVQLDRTQVALAKAAFPHITDEKEAIKRWTAGQVKAGTL